jgi:hypothetical protein
MLCLHFATDINSLANYIRVIEPIKEPYIALNIITNKVKITALRNRAELTVS